jgi:Tol biopolymer transport system component
VVRGARARSTGERVALPVGRPSGVPASGDRRRTSPPPTVLRRELREADRLLYERRPVPIMFPTPSPIAKRTSLRLPAAILAGGAILAGVADRLYVRAPGPDSSTRPAAASASGASAARVVPPETPVADQPRRPNQPVRSHQTVLQATPPALPRAQSEPRVMTARNVATDGQLVPALDRQQRPVFSPAFASNGAAMFFHTGGTHDARSALAMMLPSPIDGGDLRVVTIVDDGALNYHVQPSPDRKLIAFDSDRDGDRGVYLANYDGTDVRRISGPGYAAVPTWAPDGRRVAYIRAEPDRPKVWNLWLHSVDGSDAKRLTSFRVGQPWSASWFPDNRRICYTHEDKVIVLDLETGHTSEFSSPVERRLVRTPAVSPDGSKVIFQVFRNGAWILDLKDGSMRCVLTDPTAEEFAWAPDGRRVAFHSRRDGQWGIYILHSS